MKVLTADESVGIRIILKWCVALSVNPRVGMCVFVEGGLKQRWCGLFLALLLAVAVELIKRRIILLFLEC